VAEVILGLVLLWAAYRWIFALAALFPRAGPPAARNLPHLQILVAARNEQANLPDLLRAFERLAYDPDKLSFVFVDDGSADGTPQLLEEWSRGRPGVKVCRLKPGGGKSAALRKAWEQAPGAELTALLDADVVPAPDALALLAAEFSDPRVGAVSGPVAPSNPDAGFVARYAALELWVFHQVIQPARDRLGLNPPAVGAHRLFRTAALSALERFPALPSLAEDLETSAALVRAGWRTRFRREAVVKTRVPEALPAFLMQRRRWTAGISWSAIHNPGLSSALAAAGYLERAVFVALTLAVLERAVAWWWLPVSLIGPGLHVAIALRRSGARSPARYLLTLVCMFAVDVAITLQGLLRSLWISRRPAREEPWR
jgi:cellulose synthase/poly-beta-1,6-N-acetylglucosamine synthase-like glycosyltransferase